MRSSSPGGNGLRWDCEVKGCFNQIKRPRIEMLAQYLHAGGAAGCQFGDIDAITERNGRFLIVEWKPARSEWKGGQRYAIEALVNASEAFTVFVVVGDPATMAVTHAMPYTQANQYPGWHDLDLDGLGRWIAAWARRANACPRPPRPRRP